MSIWDDTEKEIESEPESIVSPVKYKREKSVLEPDIPIQEIRWLLKEIRSRYHRDRNKKEPTAAWILISKVEGWLDKIGDSC